MGIVSSSIAPEDAFGTVAVDAGSNPVATVPADTLTLTSSDMSVTITGNSATNTVDLTLPGGGSTYTDEQAQDAVGTILADSAEIDFTYSDATPSITAVLKNGIAATRIADGSVSDTEFQYLDGAASNIQTQLNGKQALDATLTAFAAYNTAGLLTQTAADTFTGRSVIGTANKIDVTNGDGVAGNPTITISATYVGQASITTVGTIATGIWNGTDIAVADGGTGASTAAGARTNLGLAIGTDVQAAGNYITALTGDVTASGPGSVAATIATGAVTDTKASLANKPACTVAATTNQALTGTPTIDSQATAAGSIILLTAQTAPAENGPWMAAAGAWSRPTWYPSGGTTQAFQFITALVRLGTVYQGSTWRMTTAGAITIDTTATTWVVTLHALNTTTTTGIGSTVQGYDAGLAALAAYNTNGFLVQTADNTFVGRSFADTASLAWTNPAGAAGNPSAAVLPVGISHNSLANLTTGDVHTQYAILAGRSGGQSLNGDTATGGNLTLLSTAHATKGKILFGTSAYDELNNRLGIGTAAPGHKLDIAATATGISAINLTGTITASSAAIGVINLAPTLKPDTTQSAGVLTSFTIDPQAAGLIVNGIYSTATIGGSGSNAVTSFFNFNSGMEMGASYGATITNARGYNSRQLVRNGTTFATNAVNYFAATAGNSATDNSGNTSGTLNNYAFFCNAGAASSGTGGTINNYGAFINVPNGSGATGTTNNYGVVISNNATSGDVNFALAVDSTAGSYFMGNLGIGTSSYGASMTNGISMFKSTAPTGNVTDAFQLYGLELGSGVVCPHIRNENGDIIKIHRPNSYTLTNPVGTRTLNATGSAATVVREVLGSVIQDLQTIGLFG